VNVRSHCIVNNLKSI